MLVIDIVVVPLKDADTLLLILSRETQLETSP
jgi:hypothetical protein